MDFSAFYASESIKSAETVCFRPATSSPTFALGRIESMPNSGFDSGPESSTFSNLSFFVFVWRLATQRVRWLLGGYRTRA